MSDSTTGSGEAPPLSTFTKTMFGMGATGEALTMVAFNTWIFFYYTQVLGLSGTLAGTAVTIAIFSDAITDPLMGAISDRFKSKLGRRHPFLFVGSFPLGIVFYLIFAPPATRPVSALILPLESRRGVSFPAIPNTTPLFGILTIGIGRTLRTFMDDNRIFLSIQASEFAG